MTSWQHSSRRPGVRQGRRVWGLVLCALALVLGCTGFGPPVLTDRRSLPLRLGPDEVDALARLARLPEVTAGSALVVDLDAGQTVYALRPDEARPPASTAKIMTALVVMQQVGMDEEVLVSANAAATPGSRMGLMTGERLLVRDLLVGLLLPSGNDAAVALAEHVSGSEAAFVALMNEAAAELGLSSSRFRNASGLDYGEATTSAADLVVIASAALEYPLFAEIVGTPRAEIAGRVLVNTNELLGHYAGYDGVKTGTTDAAGECLVASVSRSGRRMLAVVLGSSDRYADVRALFDYASEGWAWWPVGLPDDALAWEVDFVGAPHRLRAVDASAVFLPAWQAPLLAPVRRLDPAVPMTSTLPVGELEWRLGDDVVAQVVLRVFDKP